MKIFLKIAALLIFPLLNGCAYLFAPTLETPTVNVSRFRMLPGDSIVPVFEIGLHVSNPNSVPLNLQGLSYQVVIEGHRVLSGVSNQMPVIEAYGDGEILLQAHPDLFSTIGLFTNLMNRPRESFGFNLEALLDVGPLVPKIRVKKEGQVALSGEKHP